MTTLSAQINKEATDHDIARETALLGFKPSDFWRTVDGNRDLFADPIMLQDLMNWQDWARDEVASSQALRDAEDDYFGATE
jgi:hypothetical protein